MMHTIPKTLLIAAIAVLYSGRLTGQSQPCGTVVTVGQIAFENAFTDSVTSVYDLNRVYQLSVFIAEDNTGQPNLSTAALNEAIAQLNTAFEPIKVSFSLQKLTYIDNYHFDEIRLDSTFNDLVSQHYVQNTINIYFVARLYNKENQEIGGYTFYPSLGKDVIIMEKSALSGSFLTEQTGHFFNLYHTHETLFGTERVNKTNCSVAGDLCCDTPADPLLSVTVSADCQYTGTNRDALGDYYVPSVHNYMSFAPVNCRCYFSDEQLLRMVNCMLKVKQHLW